MNRWYNEDRLSHNAALMSLSYTMLAIQGIVDEQTTHFVPLSTHHAPTSEQIQELDRSLPSPPLPPLVQHPLINSSSLSPFTAFTHIQQGVGLDQYVAVLIPFYSLVECYWEEK